MSERGELVELPDLTEKGAVREGQRQSLDRRLFMQLHAFGNCHDTAALVDAVEATSVGGALYVDVNSPHGVALLAYTEDPDLLVGELRLLLGREPFGTLRRRPRLTMLGRTFAVGAESDLVEALIARPIRTVTNPAWPWAIWYPMRRRGEFAGLSTEEQRAALKEHGGRAMAYGRADYAHEIRLACHGLNTRDDDYVIGVVGPDLYPLSHSVQESRKTLLTSRFTARMGPVFTGKAVWQR